MLDFYLAKSKGDRSMQGPVARMDDGLHGLLFGSNLVSTEMRILRSMKDFHSDVAVRPAESKLLLEELGRLEERCSDAGVLLFVRRLRSACETAIEQQLCIFGFSD